MLNRFNAIELNDATYLSQISYSTENALWKPTTGGKKGKIEGWQTRLVAPVNMSIPNTHSVKCGVPLNTIYLLKEDQRL